MAREPTRLSFFGDYYASPLWTSDGANLPVRLLPLSVDLCANLDAWGATWTKLAMDDLNGLPVSTEEDAEHDAAAVELVARLRAELGDAYEIVAYFEEQSGTASASWDR